MRDWIWIGSGSAPPWHPGPGWIADRPTAESVRRELSRIFGDDAPAEGSIPHLLLPFWAGEEVVRFVRSVPAGTTRQALGRWAIDLRDARGGRFSG